VNINGEELLGGAEGIEVLIRDLSGANGSDPIEVVRGFTSLAHANAFARRRVRDSVEICRGPGMSPEQVRDAWFAFGEDAEVLGVSEGAWTSGSELAAFVAIRCKDREERNWRVLDPRNDIDNDEADDDA
jgi:hypothetical protein